MMNNLMKAAVGTVLAVSASLVLANEVIVTNVSAARGQKVSAFAMDVVSDGNVAGFSFRVEVPGISEKGAKLSGCVAELPSGFQGGCSIVKGSVYVIASSDAVANVLPAGINRVGMISYSRSLDAKATDSGIQVFEAEFSDNSATSTAGSARVITE